MKTRASGFTLLEVLIAMVIMAGGILMVSLSWSGNFLHIRKSTLYNDVAVLLERKMVETEAKYKDKALNEIPETDHGDFGSDHSQYRWEMKSHDLKFPDITPLLTSGDEGADESLISMVKQMTEYLNKTVKEVKVTIFVKTNRGKELQFSATQYFVDYTQNFAGLPAGGGSAAGAPAGTPAPDASGGGAAAGGGSP